MKAIRLLGRITLLATLLSSGVVLGQTTTTLVIDGPALSIPVRSESEAKRYNDINQFLLNTGFPDFSAVIAQTLNGPKAHAIEQINRETLEGNWRRMQTVNFARDLAAEILTPLIPRLGNAESAEQIANLAARFLAQKRLIVPDAFPDAVRNIRNEAQRTWAKEDYLRGAIEKNVVRMQEQIVSDSLHTIFGREKIESILSSFDEEKKTKIKAYIQRLDTLAARYVRALYYDHEMGLGHWLGEAMALALVHTSRISNDVEVKKFESLLDRRAYDHGEYLSDYVSDTLTFEDEKGQARRIKIGNGDTITELSSIAQISAIVAAGIRPHILNRWKAMRKKLIQGFVYAAVGADEETAYWKAVNGKEPTFFEKIRQVVAGLKPTTRGASHSGMAVVYRNAQSGVASTRAVDIYNSSVLPYGGARFVTTKSTFATPGVFSSFGVASLNPKKTLEFLKRVNLKEGYKPVFKISDIYRPNANGQLVKVEGETFSWSPSISESEQRKLLDVRPEDAEKWYHTELAPRLASEMVRFITEDGMSFRTFGGEPARAMSCYCSEGISIAAIRATGHELQSRPDKLNLIARMAYFVYPKLKERIRPEYAIAPNFMAWDPKTNTDVVTFVDRSLVQNWTEQMQAPRTDFDPSLTSVLTDFTDRNIKKSPMEMGNAQYAPMHLIHNVEVSVVKNPKKPQHNLFKPRVNVTAPTSRDTTPLMTYNFMPPAEVPPVAISDEALDKRKTEHSQLLKAVGYTEFSKAAEFILAEANFRLHSDQGLNSIMGLIAKMMALKPVNPPRTLPPEIKSLPEHQREAALSAYLSSFTAKQIETHTRQILSDVTGILYGKAAILRALQDPSAASNVQLYSRVLNLYSLIGAEVRAIYVDPAAADARVLGTNLGLFLIHEFVKGGVTKYVENIDLLLQTYGLRAQDFFEVDLRSPLIQENLSKGNFSVLKIRDLPGRLARQRMSLPANGRQPRVTELAQLHYSPYADIQTDLTFALDRILNRNPLFSTMLFTASESKGLFQRAVNEYMVPLNKEQMGKNGALYSSEFLRANPNAPARPTYSPPAARICKGLFL